MIDSKKIKIGNKIFLIKKMIGQGYHKQVFEIDNNKVLKIIRKDSLNLNSAFLSFKQAIEYQHILKTHDVNYAEIIDFDNNGPPYCFLVQEKITEDGINVADLIKNQKLTESDIYQIAEIVNRFEIEKKWQIDTSPFNWFRVKNKIVYTDGSVYEYNDDWSFKQVGLLQWLDLKFISDTNKQSTKIPLKVDSDKLAKDWEKLNTQEVIWWKKYLNPTLQPKNK